MEATLISPGHWQWTTASYVLIQGLQPVRTFSDFIDSLLDWEHEPLGHTQMAIDAYAVGVALEHGIRAVSDESEWFQSQGFFGWILSSDLGEQAVPNGARKQQPTQFIPVRGSRNVSTVVLLTTPS
jgi:hypothetical protein